MSEVPLTDALAYDKKEIAGLTDSQLRSLTMQSLEQLQEDRKRNQILYYEPVSDIAVDVWRCNTRYQCVGGGNGACLPLDAPVLMADGTWRLLAKVQKGDLVIGVDPKTRLAKPTKVVDTFLSGLKDVFRIKFSDGGSFRATVEHRVPLLLGSGQWTSKGNPLQAHKRRLGDYLEAIPKRSPAKRISAISPRDITYTSTELPLPPYLLGALLGDGGLTGKGVKFFNADVEVVERVRQEAELCGDRLVFYAGVSYGVSGGNVLNALRKLGLMKCNSHTKFLPQEVLGLSRKDRLDVLAGLIDTDGAESSYSTVSRELAVGFEKLVRSLGGKATVCWHNNDYDGYFQIYWRMNEEIPIFLKHKQPRNCRGKAIDYTRRVCREVELIGTMRCGDIEVEHPGHCYVTESFTVVSNSKTETMLAKLVSLATGMMPLGLDEKTRASMLEQFRGPINVRVVVESLTTTLHPIILPKLMWWQWQGADSPGGLRGHWGWMPQHLLKQGQWVSSWSDKYRILRHYCVDPENPDEIIGESTWQFMAHTQDATDFASGDYHYILHDELTTYPIWRENEARTMRVGGKMLQAFTWPDDPSIPVDWVFDKLYEPAQPGPTKNPQISWFEMWTEDNPNLDQEGVKLQAKEWSEMVKKARLRGQPIRFTNRVHPGFTNVDMVWCKVCNEAHYGAEACEHTADGSGIAFNHVQDFELHRTLPTICLLDPHPRKPHMLMWVQVDTWSDLWVVAEAEVDGEPDDVATKCREVEDELGLRVAMRIGDRNMLKSPCGARRDVTWQDEFSAVGLQFDLSDVSDVGRARVNEFLKVDPDRGAPRLHIHSRCVNTVRQLLRYVWDDFRHPETRDLKQIPKDKNDDYPTLLKYLMNAAPQFEWLQSGAPVIKTRR